jgi:hypothetical protein
VRGSSLVGGGGDGAEVAHVLSYDKPALGLGGGEEIHV